MPIMKNATVIDAIAVLAKKDYKVQDLYEKMMQDGYISHLDGEILLELEKHDGESHPTIHTIKHLGDKKQKSKIRNFKNIHKDKAKHGMSKYHHRDGMYNGLCYTSHGPERIQIVKQSKVMDQKIKDYNPCHANQLGGPYIDYLYKTIEYRMSKSKNEIYLEIMDLLVDFDFTFVELDWLKDRINYLYNEELEEIERIKEDIDYCLNQAEKYLNLGDSYLDRAEVAKEILRKMLNK